MDAKTQREVYNIKLEMQSVINELEDIKIGLYYNFDNIGNDKAAACVGKVISKCKTAKKQFDKIDTSKIKEDFVPR